MSIIEKAMNKISSIDKGATHEDTQSNIVKPRKRGRSRPAVAKPELDDQLLDLTEIDYSEQADASSPSPADTGSGKRPSHYAPVKKTDDFKAITQLLQSKNILPKDELLAQNADEYRIIKRPILANAFGPQSSLCPDGNMLMITSSLPNEGKTHVAINIALSLAHEVNNTVLLIDADIAKAHTSTVFGVEDRKGLIDLLVDESLDIEDVLVETGIPGFKVMPAGSDHTVKNELLASKQMRNLLNELSQRYPDRMIVIDSPPLLVTAESRLVSSLAGQIALVIEAARTSKHQVKDAVAMLDSDKPINIILNKTNRNFGLGQYGTYGYGYGYGSRLSQGQGENGA